MTQYISKDALVAEIENRIKEAESNCGGYKSYDEHRCNGCTVDFYKEFLEIINTFEVKEVDLEKEIKCFTMSKELYGADSVIKAVAKHFFELGLKKFMEL